MKNLARLAVLAVIVLLPLTAGAQGLQVSPAATHPAVAGLAGRYIVEFVPDVLPTERAKAIRAAGGILRQNYGIVNAAAVELPEVALNRLRQEPLIKNIVQDRPVRAIAKPDHPSKGRGGGGSTSGQVIPSGVARIGAMNSGFTGSGVGVAVVDTGIDFNHADLDVSPNCFTDYDSCQDDNGHGTHVAGIIAALDNDTDVVGVAPEATLYAVKVLDSTGSGYDSDILAGLDWVYAHATDDPAHPIQVANLSLGRAGDVADNPPLHQAFQNLVAEGITVVVAAGNDPNSAITQMVPACYPEVLAIASTPAEDGGNKCRKFAGYITSDTASYFTTDGSGVAISAPGEKAENISRGCFIQSEGILSTQLGGGTVRMSGTSMAAPHVAGVVAQMLEANGGLLPSKIRSIIGSSADLVNSAPYDSPSVSYSYDGVREGIVDAASAVAAADAAN